MDCSKLKEIIVGRVQALSSTKDLIDWSVSLNEFFILYKSHHLLQPAFENIFNRKLEDYSNYFYAYDAFSKELSELFEFLQKELQMVDSLPIFPWEIIHKKFSIESLRNSSLFPEADFFEASKLLWSFFQELIVALSFLSKPVSLKCISLLSEYLNVFTRIVYKHSVDEADENKETMLSNAGIFCRPRQTFEGTLRYDIYEPVLDFEFKSLAFHKVREEAEILAHNKEGSLWKKLDILDRWVIRTRKGISPEMKGYHYNAFCFLKVERAIKDVSIYLIDWLAQDAPTIQQPTNINFLSISSSITIQVPAEKVQPDLSEAQVEPTVKEGSEENSVPLQKPSDLSLYTPIQALTIFPYKASAIHNYAFWIVSSFSDGTFVPYFVREVVSGSEAYKFIETLLSCKQGANVNFEDASSSRGELFLTKQLAKVFFAKSGSKRDVFCGFHVFLNDLAENIDPLELQKQLNKLNKQKNLPRFPTAEYVRFVETHCLKKEILTHSDVKP